jgi:hypothetical protein
VQLLTIRRVGRAYLLVIVLCSGTFAALCGVAAVAHQKHSAAYKPLQSTAFGDEPVLPPPPAP